MGGIQSVQQCREHVSEENHKRADGRYAGGPKAGRLAGGPLNPDFGLSGEVLWLDRSPRCSLAPGYFGSFPEKTLDCA